MKINHRIVQKDEILTLRITGLKVRNLTKSDATSSCALWVCLVDDPDKDYFMYRSDFKELCEG